MSATPPDRAPLLRQLYGPDEENALPTALCLLLVTETLGRATGRADPLRAQHLRQVVRAELWYGALGLGTCGLGFFLWYLLRPVAAPCPRRCCRRACRALVGQVEQRRLALSYRAHAREPRTTCRRHPGSG
jgi:hypothetical protein